MEYDDTANTTLCSSSQHDSLLLNTNLPHLSSATSNVNVEENQRGYGSSSECAEVEVSILEVM